MISVVRQVKTALGRGRAAVVASSVQTPWGLGTDAGVVVSIAAGVPLTATNGQLAMHGDLLREGTAR